MPKLCGELIIVWAAYSLFLYPILAIAVLRKVPENRVAMFVILEGVLLFAQCVAVVPLVQ